MPAAARIRQLLRSQWHLVVLAAWSAVWFAILAPHEGGAWAFFVQGTSLLFTGHDGASARPAGLHLYASYPQLQIGPAAYPVAGVLRQLGPDHGLVAAQVVMTAMGLAVIAMTQRIAVTARPELTSAPRRLRLVLLAAGAVFVVAWQELAVAFGHLDDVMALTCAVAAVCIWVTGRAAQRRRAVMTGLAIGLAAAAKPWALGFLPVLFLPRQAADPPGRDLTARALAVGSAAAVFAAAWLPFFIADPGTVGALHFKIVNAPNSALRALGVTDPSTPSWDRPAQIALGCALGAVAIARRRWPAVILLAAGARIALDPGVHTYYTPEVMAGALLWDLIGPRRPLPVWSVLCYGALNVAPLLTADAALRGAIRLALVVAFTAAVLLAPASWYSPPVPARGPGLRGQQPGAVAEGLP